MEKYGYRFSFGPWNIHEGADPFGPPVRPSRSFVDKLAVYKELGFDAVQFHELLQPDHVFVGRAARIVRTAPQPLRLVPVIDGGDNRNFW